MRGKEDVRIRVVGAQRDLHQKQRRMHRDSEQHDRRKRNGSSTQRGTLHFRETPSELFDRRAAAYLQVMFDSEISERVCPAALIPPAPGFALRSGTGQATQGS